MWRRRAALRPSSCCPAGHLLLGCIAASGIILLAGRWFPFPVWLLATEVLATILALFLLGSFKYQIHKNALTYGMLLVIIATFCTLGTSEWHTTIRENGWWYWARHNLLSFRGLDDMIHADTMLFILGLTFFVSVIAQTRLLEGITFALLRRNEGAILPTVISVTAFVAVASGIFDGVSMIGLTIRTLVIILLLAAAPIARYPLRGDRLHRGDHDLRRMARLRRTAKSDHEGKSLPSAREILFSRSTAPPQRSLAICSWPGASRKRLGNQHVYVDLLDVIEANAQDVRFLQATRHGEVLTPIEFVEDRAAELGGRGAGRSGMAATRRIAWPCIVPRKCSRPIRERTCSDISSAKILLTLSTGITSSLCTRPRGRRESRTRDRRHSCFARTDSPPRANHRHPRVSSVYLADCAWDCTIACRCFWLPLRASLARLWELRAFPRCVRWHCTKPDVEYAEYYFLFPLFLSITLLTKAGFFDEIQTLIHRGIETMGQGHVAYAQFLGCTFLSAILDNNVVADFASRGLHGLSPSALHLFAMAQILGYALGGCWTHIGCAQSVVAFAFIRRDVDDVYTPLQWIKEITPVILEIMIALTRPDLSRKCTSALDAIELQRART